MSTRDDSGEHLADVARAAEIALVSNLVVAAGDSPGRLSLDAIDRALGVAAPAAAGDTPAQPRTTELPPAAV